MFIGYYNIANLVTLLGLVSSVLACFNAMNGNIKMGVVMFLLAGLCDMFDGRIARSMKMRSGREKLFGVQIDTVCDMVSFGLTPVIIGYALGMWGVFDILVFLFFAVCGGVRLAYFNTQAIARPDLKMDHFTGVPIPFICYVLPFLVLLMCFVPFSVMRVILPIAYLLIAVGYILKVRIAKMSLRTGLIMVAVEAACVLGLFLAGNVITA